MNLQIEKKKKKKKKITGVLQYTIGLAGEYIA